MKSLLSSLPVVLFLIISQAAAQAPKSVNYQATTHHSSISGTSPELSKNSRPLSFIENMGQVTDQNRQARTDIQFKVPATPGLNIFIGKGAIHYQFSKIDSSGKTFHSPTSQNPKAADRNNLSYIRYRMDVELIGANKNAELVTEEKQPYYEKYISKGVGKRGATAYSFNRVVYKDIYPDIDWVLYIHNGQLEHEFVLHAGAQVNDIKLKYGGATGLILNQDGSLTASTPQGIVTEQAPKSYRPNGEPVKSGFKLNGNVLSYETGVYTNGLVIDPVIEWATYYGGSGDNIINGAKADTSGNVYITGQTYSLTDIATVGAYEDTSLNVQYGNAFLAKFNNSGAIQWATYFGGDSASSGLGVTTDNAGDVFITGNTNGDSGIATAGAHQTTLQGSEDAFLAKFSSSGSLLWATYYGGGDSVLNVGTYGNSVATDDSGYVYLAGTTSSPSGIATAGAFKDTISYAGYSDAFLAKFNSAGVVQWGTYFGDGSDNTPVVATDNSGNVYMSFTTVSTRNSGLATPGAYQTTSNGDFGDAFLVKFNRAGALQWGTYYGGAKNNYEYGIATDIYDNVYITGNTISVSGIATGNGYQTTLDATPGNTNAYLAKFNEAGAIQWATYYGGTGSTGASAVATDDSGYVYITGLTNSPSGIATAGATQPRLTATGNQDAFLAQFTNAGSLQWATYYVAGYSNAITAYSIWNVYIAGTAYSNSGLATPGAYQSSGNVFLTKFHVCNLPAISAITGPVSVCSGDTITLTDAASNGVWSSSNTAKATVNPNGKVTGIDSGSAIITYRLSNSCGTKDTFLNITIHAIPQVSITPQGSATFCQGDSVILQATASSSYLWSNGSATQSTTIRQGGSYVVVVTNINSCSATSLPIAIRVNSLPAANITAGGPLTFCGGDSVTLTANTDSLYRWNNNDTTVEITAIQTGSYIVTVTDTNGCSATSTPIVVTVNPLPTAAITVTGDTVFCQGGSALLNANTGAGLSYQWQRNGNGLTGETTNSYTAQQAGSYTIKAITATCGYATSAPVNIAINPLPAASITPTGALTFCVGDTVTLTANPESSYYWSNQATTQSISVTTGGNYATTVTGANGCSATSTPVTVTVNSLPAIPTISKLIDTLTSSVATSYQWYLNGDTISDASNRELVISGNGTYNVRITDNNGCNNTSAGLNVTTLGITSMASTYGVQLYPNPNNGTFTLLFSDDKPRAVSISDVTGRLVIQVQQVSTHQDFDCSALAEGIYFVSIRDGTGVRTLNMVVQK